MEGAVTFSHPQNYGLLVHSGLLGKGVKILRPPALKEIKAKDLVYANNQVLCL